MKNKKLNTAEIVMLVFTGIITITSMWNSFETRKLVSVTIESVESQNKLVNYEVNPDIYYKVDTNLKPIKWEYTENILFVNGEEFKKQPTVNIELINKGRKPIKILGVLAATQCIEDFGKDGFVNVFVEKNNVLKTSESLINSYTFSGMLNIEKKPCTILFILVTDEISKTGQIVLV